MPNPISASSIGMRLVIALLSCFLIQVAHAKTINVSEPEELRQALSTAASGDTITLEGAAPFDLQLKGQRFSPPIIIESFHNDSLAILSKVEIMESSGIHIRNVRINPVFPAADKAPQAVRIIKSEDVSLTDCLADGGARHYLTAANKQVSIASSFSLVRWSRNIRFEENTITGFNQGLAILETTEMRVEGNEIAKMQGDGIRMGGVQKIAIVGNRIHDFLGSDQALNHSDMIQLWSTNAILISSDINIANNRLLSGNGPATQSIFMRNEQADHDLNNTDRYYRNITIDDNLIHNGHLHGITIGETFGVRITNNTLLPNSTSTMGNGAQRKMWAPTIRVTMTSTDVVVSRNVTTSITAPQSAKISQNYILSKEKFKSDAEMSALYSSRTFEGYLSDSAYMAKPGSTIAIDRIGSSLTW